MWLRKLRQLQEGIDWSDWSGQRSKLTHHTNELCSRWEVLLLLTPTRTEHQKAEHDALRQQGRGYRIRGRLNRPTFLQKLIRCKVERIKRWKEEVNDHEHDKFVENHGILQPEDPDRLRYDVDTSSEENVRRNGSGDEEGDQNGAGESGGDDEVVLQDGGRENARAYSDGAFCWCRC